MDIVNTSILRWMRLALAITLVTGFMFGCDGDNGTQGPAGTTTTTSATSLTITIDSVSINSAPVVTFSAANEDNTPFAGLTTDDLRFTIAKLTPGAWQNYINREETAVTGPGTGDTAVQATRENNGTLVDHGDGSYAYTFATDITNVTAPLAVSYDPALTHRLAIQTSGALPVVNAVYTFRPADGATEGILSREIVSTASCNGCHNSLEAHDARIETQYCVTCHNPGSTDANSGNTVDFKVMIHKIHRGKELPSVVGPDGDYDATADNGEYSIYGYQDTKHDFSDVEFPQDIRNCTKCHDGSDASTPEGDNWNTQISITACGSCHDDIDFSKDGSGNPPIDPDGHPGGIVSDNSLCVTCHASNRVAGSVAESHYLAEPVARQKFKINILKICGTNVGTSPGPICNPGDNPTVTFSVTDPTNGNTKYNLDTTPEIIDSNLSFLVGWDNSDYNNTDGTGERPGRGDSIDFDEAGYIDSGNTRTVTASFIIPDGTGATTYTASGSGAIAAQGRFAGDFDDDGIYNENEAGKERERIFVKNEIAYFRIDDASVMARRQVVDNDKCNQCHEQVSFHGGSRNGEALVCVICHNPNNTDVNDRPTDGGGGLDASATLDNKREESVDFRLMIHGIHAGARTLYDDTESHGFREHGLVIGGTSSHDYSHTRFPGILQDCETCHLSGTYELVGDWASPTENNILASTTDAAPTSTDAASVAAQIIDPAIDLNISPTAAVCSSCHDSIVARAHMVDLGGAVFAETQANITATIVETCSVCHGPGDIADVEAVHAER